MSKITKIKTKPVQARACPPRPSSPFRPSTSLLRRGTSPICRNANVAMPQCHDAKVPKCENAQIFHLVQLNGFTTLKCWPNDFYNFKFDYKPSLFEVLGRITLFVILVSIIHFMGQSMGS